MSSIIYVSLLTGSCPVTPSSSGGLRTASVRFTILHFHVYVFISIPASGSKGASNLYGTCFEPAPPPTIAPFTRISGLILSHALTTGIEPLRSTTPPKPRIGSSSIGPTSFCSCVTPAAASCVCCCIVFITFILNCILLGLGFDCISFKPSLARWANKNKLEI